MAGVVRGNLVASGKMVLLATGYLVADAWSNALIVKEGAFMNARISTGPLPSLPGELAEFAELVRHGEAHGP